MKFVPVLFILSVIVISLALIGIMSSCNLEYADKKIVQDCQSSWEDGVFYGYATGKRTKADWDNYLETAYKMKIQANKLNYKNEKDLK